MAAKLSNLTDNTWIIKGGYQKNGLLIKNDDVYNFYPSEGEERFFSSFSMVEKYFGKIKEDKNKKVLTTNISGYPTKHDDIEIISYDPPMYKKVGSAVEYYAGFYALKYSGGWVVSFCPKTSICDTYKNIGPFRNKIEVKVEVNKLNNE